MRSVLLLGSYGQSNVGDDLLMWNYLEFLRERGVGDIYVNTNTTAYIPKVVRDTYPQLHFLNTYKTSFFDWLHVLRKVDTVVYGGGTLYKELYATTGRSRYSVILRLMAFNAAARLLGAKLYHLHIGIGSLKTRAGKRITRLSLRAANYTIFRDQTSYDFARQELGLSTRKIGVSTDGLFLGSVWRRTWHRRTLSIDRKRYKKVVGINVLADIPDWIDRQSYQNVMRAFVEHLLKEGNFVVFVPFQHAFNPHNDIACIHEIFGELLQKYNNHRIIPEIPIDYIQAYLRQFDVFVAMRFHALLLAAVSQTPILAVAYDTKCWRFVEATGYPYAVQLEALSLEQLLETYALLTRNRAKARRILADISAKQYNEITACLENINL